MSLKVWLPLNGSLENKGISNITVTNNGATVNSSGKIGSCYTFSNNSIYGDYSEINNLTQISGCCWVYLTNLNSAQYFMHLGGQASWPCKFSIDYEGSIRFQINGTEYVSGITLTINTWYHITVTWDGSTAKLYVNGVEKSTKTAAGSFSASNHFAIGARTNGTAGNTFAYGISSTGKLNDIRIYDHCLSAAEVKEISQGLVLHYKLDQNITAGENIMPNSLNMPLGTANPSTGTWRTAGSNNMTRSRVAITDTPDGNGYGFQNSGIQTANDGSCYGIDSFPLEPNTIYIISMWARIIEGTEGYAGFNIYASTPIEGWQVINKNYYSTKLTADGNWTKCQMSFKTNTATTRNIYIGITTGNTSVTTQMCNIHIEKGSLADYNIIKDSSGYGHNGTVSSNSATITTNSPRYSNAIHLGKVRISSSTGFPTGDNPNFTIAFWTKIFFNITYVSYGDLCGMYDTGQGGNTFRLELCGSPPGNNLMWFRGPSGQSGGGFNMNSNSSSGWFSKDTWHHVALVGDGINKKYYCYLDGQLCQTYNGSANSWTPTGQVYLGDTTEATADFSDFRIYCTALSAEDIQSLYNTSAKIDNLQNIHTFELIENQPSIKITKTGQLKCKELTETTKASLRADDDVYANNLIER